jgi:hypothetical protein
MDLLTRQDVLAQLHAATEDGVDRQHLATWAFDQFYAEEAGTVQFEPGYRRVIRAVLDDLMFGDEESFHLTHTDVQRLIQQLERAVAQPDDALDNDANEDEGDYA